MRTTTTSEREQSLQVHRDVTRAGERFVLDDGYQLGRCLGRGGMADVWEARRDRDGRPVAVKILHPSISDLRARVRREAEVLARLPSRRAPELVAYGCSQSGEIGLVMERLFGEDLGRRLRRHRALPPAQALAIVTRVARVLDTAHDLGIVHRDIKPSNVFLCEAANDTLDLRVLDFGIAHVSGRGWDPLTCEGDFVGSPGYLAPEQVREHGLAVGPYTDVFGLAALADRLFTGYPAFNSRSTAAAAYQAAHASPAPASGVCRELPLALDAVLAAAMAKEPAERPARATDLAKALARVLA